MVTLDKDLVVIGGKGGSYFQSSLYLLSCHNKDCGWTTMTQTLQVARVYFVAMLIGKPEERTGCSKEFSNIYLKTETFSTNLFVQCGYWPNIFWHDNMQPIGHRFTAHVFTTLHTF